MKERAFTSQVVSDIRKAGIGWVHKIPDLPFVKDSGLRFQKPKPFDFIVLSNGVFHGVEVKVLKKKSICLKSDLRPHQIEALRAVVANGGKGWVLWYVQGERGKALMLDISNAKNDEKIKLDDERLIILGKEYGSWQIVKFLFVISMMGAFCQWWDEYSIEELKLEIKKGVENGR